MTRLSGKAKRDKIYHFELPPLPRLGFCLRRGLATWATNVGAEGPMREYSSREMPEGFLAKGVAAFFG
jgi:hypothetical protein